MSQFSWDKGEFRDALILFLCEHFGIRNLGPDTPMREIRERSELIGVLLGRSTAVCLHEGPIGADIAIKICSCEQRDKELAMRVAANLYRLGGDIRESWNKAAANAGVGSSENS